MEQVLTLRANTSSYTLQDVKDEIMECVKLISALGYPDLELNNYTVKFSTRKIRNYATCQKVGYHQYMIVVNKHYLELASSDNVHNTLVHEVIHSVPGCMNHGPKWKNVAHQVNDNYSFTTISRLGHDENYWKEYGSQHSGYKYALVCDGCGKEFKYKRYCDTIRHALQGRCRCTKCSSHAFKLITLDK